MDSHCPLCGENIPGMATKKVPLRGESRMLALRWYFECPYCHGALQRNTHPAENTIVRGMLLVAPCLTLFAWITGLKASLSGVLLIMAAVVLAPFVLRRWLIPTAWPRYRAHEDKKDGART